MPHGHTTGIQLSNTFWKTTFHVLRILEVSHCCYNTLRGQSLRFNQGSIDLYLPTCQNNLIGASKWSVQSVSDCDKTRLWHLQQMRSLVVKVGQVRNQILQQVCEISSLGTSKVQRFAGNSLNVAMLESTVPNPSRHRCVAAAEFQLACCLGYERLPLCSKQLFFRSSS